MALGDEGVDVSELPEPMRSRLRIFYDSRPGANNAQNNLHEYVHTQQRETSGRYASKEHGRKDAFGCLGADVRQGGIAGTAAEEI